jgi:hypothetical protein
MSHSTWPVPAPPLADATPLARAPIATIRRVAQLLLICGAADARQPIPREKWAGWLRQAADGLEADQAGPDHDPLREALRLALDGACATLADKAAAALRRHGEMCLADDTTARLPDGRRVRITVDLETLA